MNRTNIIDAKTNFTIWRICAWGGPGFLFGFGICWAAIAKFFPPPLESWSAAQVMNFYMTYNTQIRIGLIGCVVCSSFIYVWSCVISRIIQQIEGPNGVLSNIELLGGALTTVTAELCSISWLAASFRTAARTPDEIQLLQDVGWLFFDLTFMVTLFQMFAFGTAIIIDKRTTPLFPSWLGWLSYAAALSFLPVLLLPFLFTGPFAWDGLLSYYVALIPFFFWLAAASFLVFKAINEIEAEATLLDSPVRTEPGFGYTASVNT